MSKLNIFGLEIDPVLFLVFGIFALFYISQAGNGIWTGSTSGTYSVFGTSNSGDLLCYNKLNSLFNKDNNIQASSYFCECMGGKTSIPSTVAICHIDNKDYTVKDYYCSSIGTKDKLGVC